MDWYIVQYLYPNAFQKFIDIMFPNIGVISVSSLTQYEIKRLYHFFDKEGIIMTTESYNTNQWVYTISLSNGIVFGPSQKTLQNRETCEYEGFQECFRILNKKINENII